MNKRELVIGAPAEAVLGCASQAGRRLAFKVTSPRTGSAVAEHGSFWLSMVLGPAGTWCAAIARVSILSEHTCRLTLEQKASWWGGAFSASRGRGRATQLTDAILEAFRVKGWTVSPHC